MNLGEVRWRWRLRSIQVPKKPNEAYNLLSNVNNTWRNIFGSTLHCSCLCRKSVLLVLDQELTNGLVRRSAVFWPGTFCCFSHELWLLVWAVSAWVFMSPESCMNAFRNSVVSMFMLYSCARSLQHWPWPLVCVWVSRCLVPLHTLEWSRALHHLANYLKPCRPHEWFTASLQEQNYFLLVVYSPVSEL